MRLKPSRRDLWLDLRKRGDGAATPHYTSSIFEKSISHSLDKSDRAEV